MKMVPCSYSGCGDRRCNYESLEPRGKPVMIEVPDSHEGPMYCSFECAVYDGAWSCKTGVIKGGPIDKVMKEKYDNLSGKHKQAIKDLVEIHGLEAGGLIDTASGLENKSGSEG